MLRLFALEENLSKTAARRAKKKKKKKLNFDHLGRKNVF